MAIDLAHIQDTKLYTPEEVAELLDKSPHTIRFWIWRRSLKTYKIGKRNYIYGSDLKNFLLSNPVVSAMEPSHASEHEE